MKETEPHTGELQELLRVAHALNRGDFRQRVAIRPEGIAGEIADALNGHCEMLEAFRSECVRILDEMGVIGRLGGQAEVPNLRGSWHGMVNSLNHMACGLTEQIRDVSSTAQRIVQGDYNRKVSANSCQGEYAALRENINAIVDQMRQNARDTEAHALA